MIFDRRLHPVESAIASSTFFSPDGVVVVAVSGGADSMALLDALRGLGTPSRPAAGVARGAPAAPGRGVTSDRTRGAAFASGHLGGRLVVAHFDHRLREDSARDAEHVAAYACLHGLEFVLGSEDVAQRARARRTSIEETARDARYEFLSGVAARFGAIRIATAHTRSDQVETVLMRILRGTGRVGVAGIPAERGTIVRPLLNPDHAVTRADTRDYCETRGVAFVDDPSNQDVRFLRNRVRHDILPSLRAVFPSIDGALLAVADAARREQRAFAERTAGWLQANLSEEESGVWTLRLAGFDSVDDDDATALLREALAQAGLGRDVGRFHYGRLLVLVRSTHAGGAIDLPGCSARREHDALVIRKRGTRGWPSAGAHKTGLLVRSAVGPSPWAAGGQDPRGQTVTIPGRTHAGEWIVDADFVSVDEARRAIASRKPGADVAYFDADAISTRLVARSIRAGDAMRPFGLGGRRKLSDLFVDQKVPRRRRADAIVIEGESIHWVPGLATGETGRIGPGTTRVVRLKATRE